MLRILPLLILSLTFAAAADQAADAKLPADADKAYRAYQAALSKAYNLETAKVQKLLKAQEAALRKKDPVAADQVKDLLERIDKAGALTDLSTMITGGLIEDSRLGGGVEALMGTWDYGNANTRVTAGWSNRYTFKANGVVIRAFTYPMTDGGVTSGSNTLRWKIVGDSITIDLWEGQNMAYPAGSSNTLVIKLPLPATGPIPTLAVEKTATSEISNPGTLTRHVEPAKPQPYNSK